jgi:hypothetical protein
MLGSAMPGRQGALEPTSRVTGKLVVVARERMPFFHQEAICLESAGFTDH